MTTLLFVLEWCLIIIAVGVTILLLFLVGMAIYAGIKAMIEP